MFLLYSLDLAVYVRLQFLQLCGAQVVLEDLRKLRAELEERWTAVCRRFDTVVSSPYVSSAGLALFVRKILVH